MKDGPAGKTGYELLQPEWYENAYSRLGKADKKEYDLMLHVFLNTSATADELLELMESRAASVMFNIIALDIEEQAEKQQPQKIRNSVEYKKWRDAVFERDDYTCQHCHQHGGKLNAHHIKPFSEFPQLRLEVSNGITLCEKCHKEVHKKAV